MSNDIRVVTRNILFLLGISICSWSMACTATETKKDLASRDSGDGRCPDMEAKDFYRLVNNVEHWSNKDFDKVFLLKHCVDGGSLGDLNRAIGVFMEKNPEMVFQKLHAEQEPDFVVGKLAIMLPLTLVDNWKGKLERSKLRQSIIEKLDLPCCAHEREIALQALAEEIKFLEDALKEDDDAESSTN